MEILLIGCGKMGGALYDGWLKKDKNAAVTIIDPFYKGQGRALAKISDLPKNYLPNFVVLAVKPQNIEETIPELAIFKDAVFISIIAGKDTRFFTQYLPQSLIIRTMPNLPASIGKGITAAVANKELSPAMKSQVEELLAPCGKLLWLNDENLIDAVTAVSGSGPAYIFLFADCIIKAAIELGLDAEVAKTLVFETLKGSVDLAEESGEDLLQLKANVTSKGGTTEAALNVLEKGDIFKKLINNAVKEAHLRAKQLSN